MPRVAWSCVVTEPTARHARLADLLRHEASWAGVGGETGVTGVTYDSRQARPGDLFVALRGGYADGHAYAAQAVGQGAVAVVAEEALAIAAPVAVVADTRRALAGIAAEFYGHPSRELNVAGITGTDGKTSTSYLLEAMLARAGHKTGLVGTVSVKIGDEVVDHETRQTTPESLEVQRMLRRMVDAGVDWAVLEATSHGLELHRLDHVRFLVGGITNITREHLEFHKTIENYWRAKARLFERVAAADGLAVVNLDDPGARSVLPMCGKAGVVGYSMQSADGATLAATGIVSGIAGSRFLLTGPFGTRDVTTPMLGGFNVANALCAIGLALAAGVSIDDALAVVAAPPVVTGRMNRIDEGQPFAVVVDYAHTPASLEKVLTLLRQLSPGGRLIAVSGSAGERDVEKRPLQGAVSARLADISIFTNEDPRYEDAAAIIAAIADGARGEGARDGSSLLEIVERRTAIEQAVALARPGDTVLLAGKGHERSIIWNGVKHPWDEAAEARRALRQAGWSREVTP